MKRLLFSTVLCVLAVGAASAQIQSEYDTTIGTYERVTERGPYQTGRFFDNWFIGVSGGVNMYAGNGDSDASFTDRLAPALDVYLGKWITPSVGVRAMYTGLKAKGATPIVTPFATSWNNDGYYEKEFDIMSFQAHFMWNLSNAIGGYKETRTWSFVPFVGAGYAKAKANGNSKETIVPVAGLMNKIRLGGVMDLNIEARYMFAQNSFDNYVRGDGPDGMLSVTAGLAFKLGPKDGFKRPERPIVPDYTPYNQRISSLEGDLSAANAKADRLARELEECKRRPTTVVQQPVEVVTPAAMHVYFKIGSTRIAQTDMANIENIAKTIKATDMVFTVVGCADASTGSAARNRQLSNQRAKAVADALINNFGVKASQLDVDSKGGVSNHADPKMDRVVIVAPRK